MPGTKTKAKAAAEAHQPKSGPPVIAAAVSVTVEQVAVQIFVKLYMDTAGRTPIHIAEQSFKAAEAFVDVAENWKSPDKE